MFLVSLGWEVSVELALKTGMIFHPSCPKFTIMSQNSGENKCPWAALVLKPVAASAPLIYFAKQVANVQKNLKPFHVI